MRLYYEYNMAGEEAVIFDFGEAYLMIMDWERVRDDQEIYSHLKSKFKFWDRIYEPIGKNEEISWDTFWRAVPSNEVPWLQKQFFKTIFSIS
jgi:hypothetical protein